MSVLLPVQPLASCQRAPPGRRPAPAGPCAVRPALPSSMSSSQAQSPSPTPLQPQLLACPAHPAQRSPRRRMGPIARGYYGQDEVGYPTPPVGAPSLSKTKRELNQLLDSLGPVAAILPGSDESKARVEVLLKQLEVLNPTPAPLNPNSPINTVGSATSSSSGGDVQVPSLYGAWELAYASNGTVVTRTWIAQVLLAASTLPGTGLSEITQQLSPGQSAGSLQANNSAVFGLGPLGSWQVAIEGVWKSAGDGQSVKVLFDKFSVKMVGLMGQALPPWMPEVSMSLGDVAGGRGGADWVTTYLDDDLRIGRGKTGNSFVFRRKAKVAQRQ